MRQKSKSALVIGLGTGITAGALLRYPGLEQRVVVELLPEVLQDTPAFHGNFGAASDPRLEIRLRDGRRELPSSGQSYDLITLEPLDLDVGRLTARFNQPEVSSALREVGVSPPAACFPPRVGSCRDPEIASFAPARAC